MRRRVVLLVLAVAASILVVAAAALRSPPEMDVTYAEVTSGDVTRHVLTSGTLEPAGKVDIGAQVTGTVLSIVDFNAQVRAGQVVARLDPSPYEAQLVEARAALVEAEANVGRLKLLADDAKVKLERAEALAREDLISVAELDTARVTMKQAAADLRAQEAMARAERAMVAQAEVNRSHTIVRSPIDGIVINRHVEVGQTLAARLEAPVLLTVADLGKMQLLANVNESEVGEVKSGTPVSFEIESLGARRFDAKVAELRLQPIVEQPSTAGTSGSGTQSSTSRSSGSGGTATGATGATGSQGQSGTAAAPLTGGGVPAGTPPGVVSYTAVIDVENTDGRLTPGSTATLTLPIAHRAAVVRIPNSALAFSPSPTVLSAIGQAAPALEARDASDRSVIGRMAYVWKYENRRFVPIQVRTGLADERWTELLEGDVRAGDRLVTNASVPARLRD